MHGTKASALSQRAGPAQRANQPKPVLNGAGELHHPLHPRAAGEWIITARVISTSQHLVITSHIKHHLVQRNAPERVIAKGPGSSVQSTGRRFLFDSSFRVGVHTHTHSRASRPHTLLPNSARRISRSRWSTRRRGDGVNPRQPPARGSMSSTRPYHLERQSASAPNPARRGIQLTASSQLPSKYSVAIDYPRESQGHREARR